MSDKARLKVLLDDKVVLDLDVMEPHVSIDNNLEEVRSNPALFAALAGAPAEETMKMTGEQVAWMSYGSEIEITYKLRFSGANARLTEFRSAL